MARLSVVLLLVMSACGRSQVVTEQPPVNSVLVYSDGFVAVRRFDDLDRGVTCYASTNGLFCLPTKAEK